MQEIVEKLAGIEKRISSKHGSFIFFGLFLREDAPDVWDLVVSAEWIEKDKVKALRLFSQELKKDLTEDQLKKISRIAIIEQDNPGMKSMQKALKVEHAKSEILNSTFFGLLIKHAYIITCRTSGSATIKKASNDR